MNRPDPDTKKAHDPRETYRAPRIREYGRVRDLTRNLGPGVGGDFFGTSFTS